MIELTNLYTRSVFNRDSIPMFEIQHNLVNKVRSNSTQDYIKQALEREIKINTRNVQDYQLSHQTSTSCCDIKQNRKGSPWRTISARYGGEDKVYG